MQVVKSYLTYIYRSLLMIDSRNSSLNYDEIALARTPPYVVNVS